MSTQTNTPKIFISYSWKPFTNKQKVIQLAERLTSNSVHVILDDWDLKEGQDKYKFMEQMVNDPEVKRVLLICNKEYTEKANKKTGGVGIESLIVSDEIYSQAEQTKFIPIVFEYDENNKPCVPTFITTRIFIDLSNDEVFEDNYELLMRNIFDKPLSKRPPLGTPPPYIQNDDPIYLPTANKVNTIKKALIDEKKNTILFIQDYYDTFINSLPSFSIDEKSLNSENYDDLVLKSINELAILRDDFMNLLNVYTSYSLEIDAERLHSFFEKMLDYLSNLEGMSHSSNSFGSIQIDNFRFFFYELFLYFTASMISKDRFKELGFILHTPFVINVTRHYKIQELNFSSFRNHVATLNKLRNEKYRMNRISLTADIIKERATGNIKFDQLMQADALLYYISIMNTGMTYSRRVWFPETTCYHFYHLPLMKKAISQRFFEKIKPLFDVTDKEDFIAKVDDVVKYKRDNIERFYYEIPQIRDGLNINEICTIA